MLFCHLNSFQKTVVFRTVFAVAGFGCFLLSLSSIVLRPFQDVQIYMMARTSFIVTATILFSINSLVHGQSSACSTTLTPTNSIQPSVASGYAMALVATGLTSPRDIEFDTNGNLLVVEAGVGVTNLVLQDNGGTCLSVKSSKMVIANTGVSQPKPCTPAVPS